MTYRTDTFEEGDNVTWADDHYANLVGSRAAYGDGPFTVKVVHDRPLSVNRGSGYHGDFDECLPTNWDSMGHTQHLDLSHGLNHFSGAFFKKIEE